MLNISKELCYGCSACASICSHKAIKMVADDEGFKYPVLTRDLCINCGLCEKICPINNIIDKQQDKEFKAYAIQHKDKDVLYSSTSGGFFTAISDAVLSEKGVVYGAALDDTMVVRHIRSTNPIERNRIKGSKYVQSDIGNTYLSVKKDLQDNKKVLFTGTPCQVDGLIHFLQGKTDNLICIDLICHGTPSPLIFAEHIKLLEKKTHSHVVDYCFRPKNWTWHTHREIITLSNGRKYHSSAYADLWRTIYYMRLANRLSCHHCQYSCMVRPGDITIGDCRGIDRICSDINSNEGVSLVLINTKKGDYYFNQIKDTMHIFEIDDITPIMQPPLQRPSKQNADRHLFMDIYHRKGYIQAIKACLGRTYRIKHFIKKRLKLNE